MNKNSKSKIQLKEVHYGEGPIESRGDVIGFWVIGLIDIF